MSKEAMKLALETLEVWKGYMPALWDKTDEKAIIALREALAEQPAQQEPVSFLDWYDNAHWGNEDFKAGCWRAWDAALAQRTWVGLSDAELVEFSSAELGPYDLCLEVEAKLKEKNT